MASFQIFFVSTFFFFLHNTTSRAKICKTILSCDGYASDFRIKFPFQLNTTTFRSTQAKCCGYLGFNLSCRFSSAIRYTQDLFSSAIRCANLFSCAVL
ncbi:hypothetical protein ACB092_03G240700 [Castanea dentata]